MGFCHGIQNCHGKIARALGKPFKDEGIVRSRINRQSWYLETRVRGCRVSSDEPATALQWHPEYFRQENLRIEVLKRFRYLSTETNGHLSENLPRYHKRIDKILNWISMEDWFRGETRGIRAALHRE